MYLNRRIGLTSKNLIFILLKRFYSEESQGFDIQKLRNIGILAHIDAGKTTTTERMLFYSGIIKQMGEVHHGNTVTDYMAQERERGITIKSAAVTFKWKNHQFNLIDTPGHIDFTMEVEQTLNVLDGAIVVLDGCAGVEAQTLTVWRQANRYNIPRVIYVNKMDRPNANFNMCCSSIKHKLNVQTIPVQIPIITNGKLIGLIDVITMEKLSWSTTNHSFNKETLSEKDGKLWEKTVAVRNNVVDKLSVHDDNLANLIIEANSMEDVKAADILMTLRKSTIIQKVVPVLCGSSYKNIGIQPLMDSVILYMASPDQMHEDYKHFENNLSARAFKVIHDKQKGALVFFRIFSGRFNKGQKFYNVHQGISEQSGRLYVAYADEFKEVDVIENGNIAVVTGLKHTTNGDLISSTSTNFQTAKKKILKGNDKNEENVENLFGLSAKIPEPVFFCSIEPPSIAHQSALEQALIELQREDPSLRVTNDSETGQTILAGMGELHLEIIKDRIFKEYKIEADLGQIQIAYRECPINKTKLNHVNETKIGNTKHSVNITLSLLPNINEKNKNQNKEVLLLDRSPEAASNIAKIFPKHLLAVRHGIDIALSHGPKLGTQVINVQVMLHNLEIGRGTSETVISASTTQCVQKLLNESTTEILEPIMYLEIVVPEDYASSILADLSRRRCIIQSINIERSNKIITSEVPLSELLGYSTILRSLSSGTATFSMEFVEYRRMSGTDEQKAIEAVRGF